jgi:hypothetical protein
MKDKLRYEMDELQKKVKDRFTKYMKHPDPQSVKYRVHRRTIMQIQKVNGEPISGVKSLKASQLILTHYPLELPEGVITKRQIKKLV